MGGGGGVALHDLNMVKVTTTAGPVRPVWWFCGGCGPATGFILVGKDGGPPVLFILNMFKLRLTRFGAVAASAGDGRLQVQSPTEDQPRVPGFQPVTCHNPWQVKLCTQSTYLMLLRCLYWHALLSTGFGSSVNSWKGWQSRIPQTVSHHQIEQVTKTNSTQIINFKGLICRIKVF